MLDIVLKHDDQEFNFPLEDVQKALPEGLSILDQADIDDKYVLAEKVRKDFVPKTEFKRRLSTVTENAHEDAAVIARVLEKHKGDLPDESSLRTRWEEAYLNPVIEENKQLKDGAKFSALRDEARKYFNEEFVTPLADNQPSPADIAFGDQFAFDGHGVYGVDADGEPLLPIDREAGYTRRPVHEQMKILADPNGRWKGWLKAPEKGGGGSGPPGDKKGDSGNTQRSLMSDSEKANFVKEHGSAAFIKLPE